jgi:hypothetical protein
LVLLAGFLFLALWLQRDHRRDAHAVYLFGGLGLPALLWYLLMRNYVSIHPFALVLGAPFLAIASGVVLDKLWDLSNVPSRRSILWVMALVFPVLTIYPLLMDIRDAKTPYEAAQFEPLSAVIAHNTPPNAVVLSPAESAVPIYYSGRHIVRGIQSEEWLRQALLQAHAAIPDSPLFLAVQDRDREDFPKSLPVLKPIAREGDSTIYPLN